MHQVIEKPTRNLKKVSIMLRHQSQALIITFVGPVGVGKSTQIKLLRKYLSSRNVRVLRTFIKSSHALTQIISRPLAILRAYEEVQHSEGFNKIYLRRDILRRLIPLWRLLDTISIATKFFFTVYLPFNLGFTVLIEEGLMMTLHTYNVSFPSFFKVRPKTPLLLPSLIGWIENRDHINIIFDASNKELDMRRRNRSYRRNESSEYVTSQKKWMRLLNLRNTILIDTTGKSIFDVHKEIVKELKKLGWLRN